MNRLALHESVAIDLPPAGLVDVAHAAGFHSVGLRVAHSPAPDHFGKGAAAADLIRMIDHLLSWRVSVLDVGRIDLGVDTAETATSVMDLAGRMGARHITVGLAADLEPARAEVEFARLVHQAEAYGLIPLIVLRSGSAASGVDSAIEVAGRTGGGCVLTLDLTTDPYAIEDRVLRAGNRLGYLRVLIEQLDLLDESEAAGRLATVPAHIPIAVGSDVPATSDGDRPIGERAIRWARLVDAMLEHPRSRARRLDAG